ncbi:MAG: hypothetical protein Q9217_004393 [Psora testacea]
MPEKQADIHQHADPDGQFRRKPSQFRDAISKDPNSKFPAEKDRYALYLNLGCPWAHRANLVQEGWLFTGKHGSDPEDPLFGFTKLSQLYHKADPDYSGRFTTIVNNESSEIIRMFFTEFDHLLPENVRESAHPAGGFYPGQLRQEIDDMNDWVYNTVNNGVYMTGFATTQEAYESNLFPLFESLTRLEKRLGEPGHSPYLFGKAITEADIRLYTTLIRFDVAYHNIFMCNLKMIRHDYPLLSHWLRNLYWNGGKTVNGHAFKDTVDFWVYKYSYLKAKSKHVPDEKLVVPKGPLPHIQPLGNGEIAKGHLDLSSKPATAMVPIAASSQSKSKLKAFQFHQEKASEYVQDTVAGTVDKENRNPTPDQRSPSQMNPPPQPSSQRSATKELRDCPQTPIGRLPLAELLSNGDDARQNLAITPMERVLWDNSPVSSRLTNSMPAKKKRKRAHSTSPLSSSQNDTFAYFAGSKPTIDPLALQQGLKTPKADPADDLWSRYSLNTDKRSPYRSGIVPFAHIMHSSSPQTPAARLQSRDGGRRRAFSCIEWPTSAAKRRKIKHNSSQTEAVDELVKPLESAGKSKMSRVNFLVEMIHNGLSGPGKPPEQSSSEPPKPSTAASISESLSREASSFPSSFPSSSQRSNLTVDRHVTGLSQTVMAGETPQSKRLVLPEEGILDLNEAAASSDFGDDDLDLDILDTAHESRSSVNIGINPLPKEVAGSNSSNDGRDSQNDIAKRPVLTCGVHHPWESQANQKHLLRKPTSATVSNALQEAPSEVDEFNEDDADVFATDLEDVFAEYDTEPLAPVIITSKYNGQKEASKEQTSRHAATHELEAPKEVITAEIEVLSSDNEEFGNDSEFEQIAAECAEVTQEQEQEPPTQSIVRRFDRYGQCVVDNTQNLLILHPDNLISSTVVGDSFTCIRKAVLQDRVKATSDANQATVYGHMLHEIFQDVLRANKWDDEFMTARIEIIVTRYLEALFEINIERGMAVEQLKARVRDLQIWAKIFIAASPKPNAVIRDRNGAQALMCINKLLEVEEHVWSPMYGLKGNIDATVQIQLKEDDCAKTLTVPFELKTDMVSHGG